jgi:hypothetical protein
MTISPRRSAMHGTSLERCRTCQIALAPDWLDDLCEPCLDRLRTNLAGQLLAGFLSHYRGQVLHRRVPQGETRWWLRTG